MKKLLILGVIALFTACSGGENKTVETEPVTEKVATKDELQLEITKMEQELTNKMRTKFDDELAKRVVTFYRDYAQNNPKDSITPEYLFKAGEVSIGLKEYDQAAGFFERIYNNYPDYNKRVESLYLVGFVYDEHANNYGKAKEYYEKVVANHPDHGFADDAKASIETLGLSDEEIIKKFEAKQKEMAN
jgi:tetratricopeptide (TPR) repeat protein